MPGKISSTSRIQQTTALAPIAQSSPPAISLSHDDRLRRAVQLAEYLKTARPALYAEPAIRFAEITAQRQLGFANPAKRFFLSLRQLPETDPWRHRSSLCSLPWCPIAKLQSSAPALALPKNASVDGLRPAIYSQSGAVV